MTVGESLPRFGFTDYGDYMAEQCKRLRDKVINEEGKMLGIKFVCSVFSAIDITELPIRHSCQCYSPC